jgi:hypothetical protein
MLKLSRARIINLIIESVIIRRIRDGLNHGLDGLR